MKKFMNKIISILIILALSSCQNVVIINKGCREFKSGGECLSCSNRFYLDKEGICQPVNSQCRTYDNSNGACTSCYDGFAIIENTCLPDLTPSQLFAILGPISNCNQIDSDGKCLKCSLGFYFDGNRFCSKIPDTCARFNSLIGVCEGCYQGYSLNLQNECTLSVESSVDPGCSKFENGICVLCSRGYYFTRNQSCALSPPECQSFNSISERCLACYPGYVLDINSKCIIGSIATIDPGCAQFTNGVCNKCSFGFYFNKSQLCKIIPPTCKNFDTQQELCTACYPGYELSIQGCIESLRNLEDPGCSRFENGQCKSCSVGFYFGKDGKCLLKPPVCKEFNITSEICLACYSGYYVDQSGHCQVSIEGISDKGCATFTGGICTKCSAGFYFSSTRVCQQIPETCKSFDSKTEVCLECYLGYKLNSLGVCIISNEPLDINCKSFINGICKECSYGAYFDSNGHCILSDPLCKTIDVITRKCSECYAGFSLDSSSACKESSNVNMDPNCKSFINNTCSECSFRYFKGNNGICESVDPNCRLFNNVSGECLGCYIGNRLENNRCVIDEQENTDPNCAEWRNNNCFKCATKSYFDKNGKCALVDPLCLTFNEKNGECTTCYPSFEILGGKCIESSIDLNFDSHCAAFESGVCTRCSRGFYFGLNNICTQVDPLCLSFDSKIGSCISCFGGYELSGGKCIIRNNEVGDSNCANFDNKGLCTKCSHGAYFDNNHICRTISPECKDFDFISLQCKECYLGYSLANGECIVQEIREEIEIENCFTYNLDNLCLECYDRYYLSANGCHEVDIFCKNYNKSNGECMDCYTGFTLLEKKCIRQ